MSVTLIGDTATSRPSPAAPGALNTTRGLTVGLVSETSKIEQDHAAFLPDPSHAALLA
jgi:hypothetical protein